MPHGNPLHDLRNNARADASIPPDESYSSSDVNGTWVDMSAISGPVSFCCQVGSASGSPSAFSINFYLEEADDSSGTNGAVVGTQTEVTITADDGHGIGHAITTKPFVRVVVDDGDSSYTGGTTPAIEVNALVLAQKANY